jgi:anaerobic sulfite reductase subunit A
VAGYYATGYLRDEKGEDKMINMSAIMKYRASYYQMLSRLYEKEISEGLLSQLAGMSYPDDIEQPQMKEGYELLAGFFQSVAAKKEAGTADAGSEISLLDELASDYAKVFLAAGEVKGNAAFPYESVYTSKSKLVMQEAWEEVTAIYAERGLGLVAEQSDIKEDHIAIELKYMAYLCGQYGKEETESLIAEQKSFLEKHLLNWVGKLEEDILQYARSDFYKGVGKLTLGYLTYDAELLDELLSEDHSGEKVNYTLSQAQMDDVIAQWKKEYRVYAPKAQKNRGAKGKDVIRYQEINSVAEIVTDRQSDFSAKEVYYPVMQTMFYFTEKDCIESEVKDDKGFIIFMRPCDVNAMRRLDNIFLKNGDHADSYYERLRKKVKVVMMECTESHENCFCVSMNSNIAENYSLAVRLGEDEVKVKVADDTLAGYFADCDTCEFELQYVTENAKKVVPPVIESQKDLQLASTLEYWNKFDDNCIGCGGCNTVCPTCSCFDTVDVIYNETSKEGERRRVWSSCMLDTFTMTAGGGRARKTAGANMRFKSLHKMYDYGKRFGEGENMCVGCGRCVGRCSQDISFIDTINEFHDALEQAKGGE